MVLFLLGAINSAYSVALVRLPYGGRFADQLVHYIRIKWLAKKYGADFFHIPFDKSDQLVLDYKEPHFDQQPFRDAKKSLLMSEQMLAKNERKNVIFELDYRCDFTSWYLKPAPWREIVSNSEFVEHIKQMIKPVNEIPQLPIPKERISVAVHIRTGGGLDISRCSEQEFDFSVDNTLEKPCIKHRSHYADCIWPLKFLPLQFYIDQIKLLSDLLADLPLYVYIFTDDQDPGKLCRRLKEKIGKSNIMYACRNKGNHYSRNVVEDMFAMAYQFDCLIRGGSHFGLIPDFIGNHKLVIRPVKAFWYGNKLVVTKVDVVAKDKKFAVCFGIEDQCTDGLDSWVLT